MRRQSIHIPGFVHKNPIPGASRIGQLLMSGVINGVDPQTGRAPAGLSEQCGFLFTHMRSLVAAAGGSLDDVIKVTVWMQDRSQRDALNAAWLDAFPDEASRPARHTLPGQMEGGLLVQCDFVAVLPD